MKNFMKFTAVYLSVLVAVTCTCFAACNHKSGQNAKRVDSIMVQQMIEDYSNPQFEKIEDMDCFRDIKKEEFQRDSIFLNMPEAVYENVSEVCANKYHKLSVQKIVDEYIKNKDVYNNLKHGRQTVSKVPVKNECPEYGRLESDTIINTDDVLLIKQKITK